MKILSQCIVSLSVLVTPFFSWGEVTQHPASLLSIEMSHHQEDWFSIYHLSLIKTVVGPPEILKTFKFSLLNEDRFIRCGDSLRSILDQATRENKPIVLDTSKTCLKGAVSLWDPTALGDGGAALTQKLEKQPLLGK